MKKSNKLAYVRYKSTMKIIGEVKDVKALIWFDQISNKLIYVLIFAGLLCSDVKFVELLIKWLDQLF